MENPSVGKKLKSLTAKQNAPKWNLHDSDPKRNLGLPPIYRGHRSWTASALGTGWSAAQPPHGDSSETSVAATAVF